MQIIGIGYKKINIGRSLVCERPKGKNRPVAAKADWEEFSAWFWACAGMSKEASEGLLDNSDD